MFCEIGSISVNTGVAPALIIDEIEAIYVCKCNWNDGCDCRKPEPGMIFDAQYDHDINLSKTYFIGDDKRDMEAAKRAACKQFLIGENDRLDDVIKTLLGN